MSIALSVLTPGVPGYEEAIEQVAALRIAVFREWPYLYDGTVDFERWYIAKLAEAEGAIIVAAKDGDDVIGVSTGMPLLSEHEELIGPFSEFGFDPAEVFYGAETVTLPEYRGRGLYREFLERRRAHAKRLGGFRWETFCGVVRPADHPLRDHSARPVEAVWERLGYRRVEGLTTGFSWKELDQDEQSEKVMQFWIREL